MKVQSRYTGEMRFEGGEGDSLILMDAKREAGGKGVAHSPKQLVLQGLAGCTGMDVVTMLKRKKVAFEDFSISAEGELTSTHPKVFKRIDLVYSITADPADREHIERVIVLSKTQFCGVSAMLSKTAEIGWELNLTPAG